MSESTLVIASVLVIVALIAVLAIYLLVVGQVVRHLAATLDEKIKPGAAGLIEHIGAVESAAGGVRRALSRTGRSAAPNAPTSRY